MRSRLLGAPVASVTLLVACAAIAGACNGIIGTSDVYYVDPDAQGPSGPEGGSDGYVPNGDGSAQPDTGPCGDTQSSGDNCGTCGHSCLGGKCEMGSCQPVAIASTISPRDLYVDQARVYWIEPLTSYMQQANLDGKSPVLLGGGTSNFLQGLAIDDTSTYWGSLDGLVLRCKIGGCGGSPTKVTAAAAGIATLAVDAVNVYWAATDSNNTSTVYKLAKTSTMGTGTVLATSTATQFEHVAADGAFVYFTADDGMIRRVPVGGGATTVIGKGTAGAINLVLDETNVYWSVSDLMSGTINMAAKDGSSPNQGSVIAGSQDLPLGLAVDATNVYWVNAGSGVGGTNGTVMTCTLGACTPKVVAKNQLTPVNVAVDKTAIYWSNYASGNPTGAVMRLAR